MMAVEGVNMQRIEIERYLRQVGSYLQQQGLTGEILLLGGAYMTLVLRQPDTTRDVDAYFAANQTAIREAAASVAREYGLPLDWLNDAAKGFLYVQPEVTTWLECPGLRVYAPSPSYIFSMKALAGRPVDQRDPSSVAGTPRPRFRKRRFGDREALRA